MASQDSTPGFDPRPARRFATTRWSVVAAAQDPASPTAQEALATLCSTYWSPLYAFIRRQGFPADQAQDLTQGFFAWLLERHALDGVDPHKGKFRSFLLTSCKHYLSHERERARALKRGGGRTILSLDFETVEAQYQGGPADKLTPEKLFARRWALGLLERVLTRLRAEFSERGKSTLFDQLRVFLLGGPDAIPHARVAQALGMKEGAVKVAAHRLRHRFRELVREEIAQTVDRAEDIDDEIRDLFAALAP